MKKYLVLIYLLFISGCGILPIGPQGEDNKIYYTFTIEGTADSTRYYDGGFNEIIFKDEYPAERKYTEWTGCGCMNVTIQNVSDTGYIYLTIKRADDNYKHSDTTYVTLEPSEYWGYP